jgi:hypothetical protein
MGKRLTETTIWEDDWFYELSAEYKLFWFYIKDNCDHAGLWKPKTRAFKNVSDVEIDLSKALEYFNSGKQRVRLLKNGYWLLEDFFYFQYVKTAKSLNLNNKVHKSAYELYLKHDIRVSSIRGINHVIDESGTVFESEYFDDMDAIYSEGS